MIEEAVLENGRAFADPVPGSNIVIRTDDLWKT